MQIIHDNVTWQRSHETSAELCADPVPIQDVIPPWFKQLRGSFSTYSADPGFTHTARHCLGLRGAMTLGWTIPWRSGFIRGVPLHTEQLHGSIWAEQHEHGPRWHLHVMCYPWRAKLPQGWRLLMYAHPLVWSHDWFSFAGAVDANYTVINGTDIGSFWNYDYEIEQHHGYFNLEHVMAFRERDGYDDIPEGTPLFAAVPVYDPSYVPRMQA